MRLSALLEILQQRGLDIVGTWEIRGRKGVYLGDPKKYFPYPAGPQYTVDTTEDDDRELTEPEVDAIKRRFGLD